MVSTPPAPTETTLAFVKELFRSGLEPIQDGFGKHLTRYAQESNTSVVVADGLAYLSCAEAQEVVLKMLSPTIQLVFITLQGGAVLSN